MAARPEDNSKWFQMTGAQNSLCFGHMMGVVAPKCEDEGKCSEMFVGLTGYCGQSKGYRQTSIPNES